MVVEAVIEHAAPHFLKARLERVIAQPRHRELIPVMAN
jgi:hypothetical protein